ncbi:hypothetical protein [Halapricum salinum]|uniref:Uncharacterized protein n=1 Tax=Halapricum salinum TaxID=1457250 RepID=A0A4D6H820_9EURY|nr:hypothetical protein [Halapricum salinum]QCC49765.1 hypothetical protein DV733_00330 [Halapricum salinum]
MKGEHFRYLIAVAAVIVGIVSAFIGASVIISLASLSIGAFSVASGKKARDKIQQKERIIEALITEKSELRTNLKQKRDRVDTLSSNLEQEAQQKQKIRAEKQKENQRLQNLKRVLRREGIDTSYLVDKYDNSLYAPVLVLTHFSSPNHNDEDGEEVISENLESLSAKTLHGATKIIPPRNFDQDISGRQELQEWFDEEVLSGNSDLAHRLEFLSVVDINQVFDRDNAEEDEVGYPANTVNELFDTDTVIPTEDLLDILARSDKISIESEIRQNIALLAVPNASKDQMNDIIESQKEIQDQLGNLTEIANTSPGRINSVLSEYDVDNADQLARAIQREANRLKGILDSQEMAN